MSARLTPVAPPGREAKAIDSPKALRQPTKASETRKWHANCTARSSTARAALDTSS